MADLGTTTIDGYLALHAGHENIVERTVVLSLGGSAITSGDYIEIPHIGISGTITAWYAKADASGTVTTGIDYASSFGGAYSEIFGVDLSSQQTNSATGLGHSIVRDGMLRLQADSAASGLIQLSVAIVIASEVL